MTERPKIILPPESELRQAIEKKEPPELNFIVKSPGMAVRFGDGTVVHMNRATRRKNKLYGNRVRQSGR